MEEKNERCNHCGRLIPAKELEGTDCAEMLDLTYSVGAGIMLAAAGKRKGNQIVIIFEGSELAKQVFEALLKAQALASRRRTCPPKEYRDFVSAFTDEAVKLSNGLAQRAGDPSDN